MKITYQSVYYADVRECEPPAALRAKAEAQVPFLLPTRRHVLTTKDGETFLRQPLATSQGWIVTYLPEGDV